MGHIWDFTTISETGADARPVLATSEQYFYVLSFKKPLPSPLVLSGVPYLKAEILVEDMVGGEDLNPDYLMTVEEAYDHLRNMGCF